LDSRTFTFMLLPPPQYMAVDRRFVRERLLLPLPELAPIATGLLLSTVIALCCCWTSTAPPST
jgi:hypothetical protein